MTLGRVAFLVLAITTLGCADGDNLSRGSFTLSAVGSPDAATGYADAMQHGFMNGGDFTIGMRLSTATTRYAGSLGFSFPKIPETGRYSVGLARLPGFRGTTRARFYGVGYWDGDSGSVEVNRFSGRDDLEGRFTIRVTCSSDCKCTGDACTRRLQGTFKTLQVTWPANEADRFGNPPEKIRPLPPDSGPPSH
jgi:hypothetical protein